MFVDFYCLIVMFSNSNLIYYTSHTTREHYPSIIQPLSCAIINLYKLHFFAAWNVVGVPPHVARESIYCFIHYSCTINVWARASHAGLSHFIVDFIILHTFISTFCVFKWLYCIWLPLCAIIDSKDSPVQCLYFLTNLVCSELYCIHFVKHKLKAKNHS